MVRGGMFGKRTTDGDGAALALAGGTALAVATLVVLLGLAEIARALHALPWQVGPIF
jgi:hypothetical protein